MKRQVFLVVLLVLVGWFCVYAYNVTQSYKESDAKINFDVVKKERDVFKRAYLISSKDYDKKELLNQVMKHFSFTSREQLASILMIKEQAVVEEPQTENSEQK